MNYQEYDEVFDQKKYPKFREIEKKDTWLVGVYRVMPEDYGPCLCMSGKNFKFCCKERMINAYRDILNGKRRLTRDEIYEQRPKKILSRKIVNSSIAKKNISYCFAKKIFCDCDTANYNVKSHTMAKGNVFRNLSGNYVMGFDDHIMEDEATIENIGKFFEEVSVDDASTTVSFCKTHDTLLFGDIELEGKREYNKSYIENLEYALKAITYDIYYRILRVRYLATLFSEHVECADNKYIEDYKENVDVLFALYEQANCILQDIKSYKEKGSESPNFQTTIIEVPLKKIQYSLSECIVFGGKNCFLNVVNIPKPYILISYYGQEKINFFEKKKIKFESDFFGFIEEVVDLTLSTTHNIFFNLEAFKKLSDETKQYLYQLHRRGSDENEMGIPKKVKKEIRVFLFEE